MTMLLRIGLIGAGGRMGRVLTEAILHAEDLGLVAAVEAESSPLLHQNVVPSLPLVYTASVMEAAEQSDVLVDFSSPQALGTILEVAEKTRKPLVCGVTGLDSKARERLRQASTTIPLFYSANMSVGICVLAQAVELVARSLGEEFEIEIQDIHHAKKKDAPSGTALLLGETAAKARQWRAEEVFSLDRTHQRQERSHRQIGFAALRGGSTNGQHSVFFLGPQESLTLSHESCSRAVFAEGALKAARWIVQQPSGLYEMKDMMTHPTAPERSL